MVVDQSGDTALQRIPIYSQLRELFVERIKTGQWSPRSPLPSELQLAGEFRVSVGTVRRVMDELSDLGLVTRSRGRGTFVSEIHTVGAENGVDPLRNQDGSRIVWDPPRVEAEVGPASIHERTALGIRLGEHDVLRLTWLMTRNKQVVARQQSAVPLKAGIDVSRSRHIQTLAEVYARSGILLHRCEDALAFRVPDRQTSAQLNTPDGAPLLLLTRKLLDERRLIVGVSFLWFQLKDVMYTSSQRLVDI